MCLSLELGWFFLFWAHLLLTWRRTLTGRLIPLAFALLSHGNEQVRRAAHAVLHSLLAHAPLALAQQLVPAYCRIALTSALVDDVPVTVGASNAAQIADYLYERYVVVFLRFCGVSFPFLFFFFCGCLCCVAAWRRYSGGWAPRWRWLRCTRWWMQR